MEVITEIIQISGLITALIAITTVLKKQVSKDIRKLDYSQAKTYLTDFLSEVEDGVIKKDIQIQRATEIYDHYIKDLKGNSYIKTKWDKLMIKEGGKGI